MNSTGGAASPDPVGVCTIGVVADPGQTGVYTIGVVADTHIPDRARSLHPGLLPALRAAGAARILHAGDICVPAVLAELAQVAPVTAARGNRDWFVPGLKIVEELAVHGARIALTHGHGGFFSYLLDKAQHFVFGYRVDHYVRTEARVSKEARVIVFGHTHQPVMREYEGKLLFNPGSAGLGAGKGRPPTFGLLHIAPDGTVRAEIVPLPGYRLERGQWLEDTARENA